MLTSKIQKSIRQSYQNLQTQLDNFVPSELRTILFQKSLKHSVGNITSPHA
ncbi:ATP-dependent helicase DinG/Rad3 [Vibrio maritimus]|uniref:ATP-dependent helicase DinG/Rad3 n=1 Tax=Vibrio maritimus TaxID=990268 RepID=A0A090RYC9_9VIBR|nr:ATP-dependent helicase DinG/Rad3 [Vibrio maritimus]